MWAKRAPELGHYAQKLSCWLMSFVFDNRSKRHMPCWYLAVCAFQTRSHKNWRHDPPPIPVSSPCLTWVGWMLLATQGCKPGKDTGGDLSDGRWLIGGCRLVSFFQFMGTVFTLRHPASCGFLQGFLASATFPGAMSMCISIAQARTKCASWSRDRSSSSTSSSSTSASSSSSSWTSASSSSSHHHHYHHHHHHHHQQHLHHHHLHSSSSIIIHHPPSPPSFIIIHHHHHHHHHSSLSSSSPSSSSSSSSTTLQYIHYPFTPPHIVWGLFPG